MTVKQSIAAIVLVAATSVGSIWGYGQYQQSQGTTTNYNENKSLFKTASYDQLTTIDPDVDFEKAATKAVPAVAHIRTVSKAKQVAQSPNLQNSPLGTSLVTALKICSVAEELFPSKEKEKAPALV